MIRIGLTPGGPGRASKAGPTRKRSDPARALTASISPTRTTCSGTAPGRWLTKSRNVQDSVTGDDNGEVSCSSPARFVVQRHREPVEDAPGHRLAGARIHDLHSGRSSGT